MSTLIDPALLALPPPFDQDVHNIRFEGEWDSKLAEAALATVEILTQLYRTGYPVVETIRFQGRDRQLRYALEDLQPTLRDLNDPSHCVLPKLNVSDGVASAEVVAFIPRYGQACAFVAMVRACSWLSRKAHKRFDWPGTARFLQLAEENWRHLPEEIATILVGKAGVANGERAFPLLRMVMEDTAAPQPTRRRAQFVGSLIANPIDPKIFDATPLKK